VKPRESSEGGSHTDMLNEAISVVITLLKQMCILLIVYMVLNGGEKDELALSLNQ
jgi:hypothetical protein